jgi:hypothetical protein
MIYSPLLNQKLENNIMRLNNFNFLWLRGAKSISKQVNNHEVFNDKDWTPTPKADIF